MKKENLSLSSTPRGIALDLLNKIESKDIPLNYLLEETFKSYPALDQRDRSFITELVYGTIRWRGKVDWVISKISHFTLDSIAPVILNILRMGVYQCLFLDRVPNFAAVNEAVKLAKILKSEKTASFVNGTLRNIIRNKDKINYPSMSNDKDYAISINYSHPLWLVKKWINFFGEKETIRLCKANNQRPQMTLSTNTLKISRPMLVKRLKEAGCSVKICQ